jgi:hypothetical protein
MDLLRKKGTRPAIKQKTSPRPTHKQTSFVRENKKIVSKLSK